jgi:hypothetical protein
MNERIVSVQRVLAGTLVAVVALLAAGCDDPPTLSLDGGSGAIDSFSPPSVKELVQQSDGVLRGRFLDGPTVVYRNVEPEAGIREAIYVWDFDVSSELRNVYPSGSEASRQISAGSRIKVALLASDVEKLRGSQSFREYHESHPSRYNFNSYPTNREVLIFTYPAVLPEEVLKRHPSLASAQVVAGGYSCYDAEQLVGPCLYAADSPGGDVIARIESSVVPSFTADELSEALSSAPATSSDPQGEG